MSLAGEVWQFFRQTPWVAMLSQSVNYVLGNCVPFFLAEALPKATHDFARPDESVSDRKAKHVAPGLHGAMRT
jgi:hypothetical protein